MMIDDAALNALEAKAQAATPGPWSWGPSDDYYVESKALPSSFPHHFKEDASGRYVCWAGNWAPDFGQANAAYIAALDPPTALALIARIRELEAERDIVKRFMAMIWRWCNRPNVTDAERISFIRHHPTLEKWVEPPDDAYRDGVPEAARISKEAADG